MIILAPIEFILRNIFEFSYSITKNYGFSLILMSFVVTIGTYPLYYLADIWKKKEDNIQLEMKKEIDDIKRAFKGQKQFYMIQATYRFHNYKSWYALRAALGLLIQIPFFFAAYNMLSSYQGYAGHSFLCFTDLAKADGLLYGVNFLPILMTLVNILSSVIYSRSLSIKANKQLLILALVFFVFLYNSPAALLIYWTCNNLLSLVKSYFLNKNKPLSYIDSEEKRILKGLSIPVILYSIMIINLFIINHHREVTKELFLADILITILIFLFSSIYTKRIKESLTNLFCLLKQNILVTVFFCLALFLYLFKPDITIINITRLEVPLFLFCIFIYQISIINYFFPQYSLSFNKSDNKQLFLSFIFFNFVLSLGLPLKYYLQAPEEAGCKFSSILLTGVIVYIFISLITYLIIHKAKYTTILIGSFIIIASSINLLFPLNVGVISGFELTMKNNFLNVAFANFCKDLFIGFISFVVLFYLYTKKAALFKFIPIIVFLVATLQIFQLLYKNSSEESLPQKISETSTIPDKYLKMHALSPDKPNIIYICLDMFNGEYIPRIREDIPDFDRHFNGFTYYKDTLSISGWTVTSFGGSLYYGNDYSPINNNKNKTFIIDSGKQALVKLKSLLTDNGYDYSFINDSILHEVSVGAEKDFSIFAYYWCNKHNIKLGSVNKIPMLEMFSLFQLSPALLKFYIYNGANWVLYGEPYTKAWNRDNAIKTLSYLDLLPELSSATSDSSKFLFIRNELSHSPFGIDKNGELIDNSYPDEINKSFSSPDAAYYSCRKCIELLINYFTWLKENNLWDNSVIVLFSDHGNNCRDNNIPVINSNDEDEINYKSRANALYMIKPLNAKNDFYLDKETLKSNGDILYDVFEGLNIKNDIKPCTNDGVRYYSFMKIFEQYEQEKTEIDYASYKVTGSIFDKNSWEEIN